jgi:hypothetical protein
MMPDHVAPGRRRVLLDLTLTAVDAPIPYRPDLFAVDGGSVIRTSLGEGVLPAGTAIRVGLTIEIPDTSTRVALRFGGAQTSLPMPPG